MEYRKRQRRARNRRIRHDSYAGTILCVVLLFAAIVYLIGVSSAGTWMAKTVVAPVFRTLGISSDSNPSSLSDSTALAAPVTDTLRFNEKTSYALQMGVYSNVENAAKQSASLQDLGAGGYVLNDNEKFRVLAAAYPKESDLTTVRTRLSEEGLESTIFLIVRPAVECIITASQEQIKAIQSASENMLNLGDDLYAIIYSFDSEKQSVSVGKSALTILRSELEQHATSISAFAEEMQLTKKLKSNYDAILAAMDETISYNGEETTVFSAKMKYLHLAVEDMACQFINEIDSQ